MILFGVERRLDAIIIIIIIIMRLSVAIQRFNSVLIQETFDFSDGLPDL